MITIYSIIKIVTTIKKEITIELTSYLIYNNCHYLIQTL